MASFDELKDKNFKDPVSAFDLNELVRDFINVLKQFQFYIGKGTPEGSIKAQVGSLYLRTDGGTSTVLYIKESGDSTTGWIAK